MQNEDFVQGVYGGIQGTLTLLVSKHSGYVFFLCILSKTTQVSLIDYHNHPTVSCFRCSLFDPSKGTHDTNGRRPDSDQELHHVLLPHLTCGISMSSLFGLDTFHGVHHCPKISGLQGIPKEGRDFPSIPHNFLEASMDFAVWRWTKRVGCVGQAALDEDGLIVGNQDLTTWGGFSPSCNIVPVVLFMFIQFVRHNGWLPDALVTKKQIYPCFLGDRFK